MDMVAAVMVVALAVIVGGDNSMSVRRLGVVERVSSCFIIDRSRGGTDHRDGRKRLNRKAQCEQHDKKEFAPVGHGCRV